MIIREIQKVDNETVAQIIRSAFEELGAPKTRTVYSDPTTDSLYELFEGSDKSQLFVAEEDGQVLGSCGVFPTEGLEEGVAELVKFYLRPSARGKGIGKKLFERSISAAIAMDYHSLYIESGTVFKDAVQLYLQYGFEYLKHPLGNSGHSNCNIWMIKHLQNE